MKNLKNGFLALILSAGALGIFVVPWHVPVTEPAMGQSYTYGFNNSVAILSVGLTLGALFVYTFCRRREIQGGGMERAITETLGMRLDGGGNRGLILSYLSAAIVFGSLIAAGFWYVPFGYFGEMGYFISRIELLVLHRAPYYDFPFDYGPWMIYIPFQLYKVAHGLLSVEQAYCVILILHWILGLLLLAWCVRLLVPAFRQAAVFWLFAVLFLNPTLGYQYTPLRYMLPIAAVLFNHYAVATGRLDRFRGHWMVALAALLGPFLNFELSPEMGVAATAAILVYYVALLRTPQRAFAHGAVLAVLGALLAIFPWSTAYLGILTSFGGSLSLPIFPGLGILLFLAAEFFLLPRLAVIGVTSREGTGPACLALCILSGILIVPALSRCDIGHVFHNSLAVYIVALASFARLHNTRWFKGTLAALVLVFAVLGQWLFLFHYSGPFKAAIAARAWMRSHPVPACQPASNGFLFSKQYPPIEGLEPLLAYGNLAAPLGCPGDIEQFLLLHGRYEIGYNPGNCSDIWMLKQTARALREIEGFRTILVPKAWFEPDSSSVELDGMDYRFLRNTELFPVRLVERHPRFIPERVMAARIAQEFSVVGEFRDCQIMVRRGTGGRVSTRPAAAGASE